MLWTWLITDLGWLLDWSLTQSDDNQHWKKREENILIAYNNMYKREGRGRGAVLPIISIEFLKYFAMKIFQLIY